MRSSVPDPATLRWFQALHSRWYAARGKGVKVHVREFRYDWLTLLDESGLRTAAEVDVAKREAEMLENAGFVKLYRHKHRNYIIERIGICQSAESELGQLFAAPTGIEIANACLPVLFDFQKRMHLLHQEAWAKLCRTLIDAVPLAKIIDPFDWHDPTELALTLEALYQITSRSWPPASLIRTVSVSIGQDSKWLEWHQRKMEKCLHVFFAKPTSLSDLGIMANDYLLEMSGPLSLHYQDGSVSDFSQLQSHYALAASDIARCARIATPAIRVMTIENSKTTFRHFSAANDHTTLLIASSYPTHALRNFFAKLPPELPLYHFGDTDPAGWHIFAKIREHCRADAQPFQMKYRATNTPQRLTAFDRKLLPKLLQNMHIQDLHHEICRIVDEESKGNFEQETIGAPTLKGWPFYL